MGRMPLVFNDPRHWHARAAEAREIADRMMDPKTRASMMAVAEQYETIAARAVKRLKANAKGVPPLIKDDA